MGLLYELETQVEREIPARLQRSLQEALDGYRAHGRMTDVATTRRAERPEPDRLSSRRAERPAFGQWATGGGRVRKVRPPPLLPTRQLERWRFAVYRRPADVDIGGGAAGHVDDHALGTMQMKLAR